MAINVSSSTRTGAPPLAGLSDEDVRSGLGDHGGRFEGLNQLR